MKYIKEADAANEKKHLMELIEGLFDSRNLKVDIVEKNMNFALNVKVTYYPTFDEILNVLDAFRAVEGGMTGYTSEVELWQDKFTLYLDKEKKGGGYHPDIRTF